MNSTPTSLCMERPGGARGDVDGSAELPAADDAPRARAGAVPRGRGAARGGGRERGGRRSRAVEQGARADHVHAAGGRVGTFVVDFT
eukprot:31021-Pelagococcus_subviridis.AAC.5